MPLLLILLLSVADALPPAVSDAPAVQPEALASSNDGWRIGVIDLGGDIGRPIAVDAQGQPRVSYFGSALKFASDYTVSAHPTVAFALRSRSGGYNVELGIPVAQLGNITMQAGRVIGFNIGLIDDDNGGEAEGWLGWSGNTFRHAELCGDLILAQTSVTPTATATRTSTNSPTMTPTRTPSRTSTPTPTSGILRRRVYLPVILK